MSRYLVTGAAGFIGRRLVQRLLGDGHVVVGIDRCGATEAPNYTPHCFDIRDTPQLRACLAGGSFDAVFHLAATSRLRATDVSAEEYESNNVGATDVLLQALRHSGCHRFVLASSSAVYGDTGVDAMREDGPLGPARSDYARSKQLCEEHCAEWSKETGIATIILRLFTVYGPGGRPDMAVDGLLHALEHDVPFTILGSGEASRDFVHVDDATDAFTRTCRGPEGCETFNIGTGIQTTVHDLVDIVSEAAGRQLVLRYVGADPRDALHARADVRRATAQFGFVARIGLREGIARMLRERGLV